MKSVVRILKNPQYRVLLAAKICIGVSQWINLIFIFSVLTFYWKAPAAYLGYAASLYGLPGLVLGPYAGYLADRWPVIRVLGVTTMARSLALIGLILAPTPEIFLLAVLIKGTFNLGYGPAEQIALKTYLKEEDQESFIALNSLIDQLTKISAPILGGALSLMIQGKGAFLFTATLEFTAALVLITNRAKFGDSLQAVRAAALAAQGKMQGVFGGLKEIWSQPVIATTVAGSCFASFWLFVYDPQLSRIVEELGRNQAEFGQLISATATGAVLAALTLMKRKWKTRPDVLHVIAIIGFGLVLGAIYFATAAKIPQVAYLSLWVANGFVYSLIVMSYSLTVQRFVPVHVMGRVTSTARTLQMMCIVIAPLLGGLLSRQMPAAQLILVASVGAVSSSLALAFAAWGKRSLEESVT